ncbi:MAG TPA: hypothetical protein VK420_12505 [Longimicrobium sp.]|nr:hypothetical protein [Longimicrobium sp.]
MDELRRDGGARALISSGEEAALRHARFDEECAKLDPSEERALAEEGLAADLADWPMDQVEETGEEIIIMKCNRPVAKLAPVREEGLRPFLGRSGGVISASREDLIAPIGENWEADADL